MMVRQAETPKVPPPPRGAGKRARPSDPDSEFSESPPAPANGADGDATQSVNVSSAEERLKIRSAFGQPGSLCSYQIAEPNHVLVSNELQLHFKCLLQQHVVYDGQQWPSRRVRTWIQPPLSQCVVTCTSVQGSGKQQHNCASLCMSINIFLPLHLYN